jgi:hypothetical protein
VLSARTASATGHLRHLAWIDLPQQSGSCRDISVG